VPIGEVSSVVFWSTTPLALAPGPFHRQPFGVQPLDITPFDRELAIRWADGDETFLLLETLRRFCPCATCAGEQDILGNTYRSPTRPYSDTSFVLARLDRVGGYGIQPVWADGHATGIYTWEYLRRLATAD
jgi:DUF971 family protein